MHSVLLIIFLSCHCLSASWVKESFIFLVTQANTFESPFFPNIVYQVHLQILLALLQTISSCWSSSPHHPPVKPSQLLLGLQPLPSWLASWVPSPSFFSAQLPEHLVKTKSLRSWPSLLKTLQDSLLTHRKARVPEAWHKLGSFSPLCHLLLLTPSSHTAPSVSRIGQNTLPSAGSLYLLLPLSRTLCLHAACSAHPSRIKCHFLRGGLS